jgi:thiamine kinase-like enzyme
MQIPSKVLDAYFNNEEVKSVAEFGNGHIQSTFKVESLKGDFILQKINTNVFPQPTILIDNHRKTQKHSKSIDNQDYKIPEIIKTFDGEWNYESKEFGFWRLTSFITNSYSLEKTETPNQAFEAGKAYGWFAKIMQKADVGDFEEAIPQFHSLSLRLKQFEDAIKKDVAKRKKSVKNEIDFFLKRKDELLELEQLIIDCEIPKRIVHNDTKINNVLFKNEKAVAVIDLDTVGPGSILFDYGDALRTIANTADEDEEDLKKVKFSFDNFSGFTKGYLSQTASFLTKSEKQNLHLAPVLMTYIIGIRFLTDFLNGDVYFKTKKENHNLIRTRVQQELIKDIEKQMREIKESINQMVQ